MTGRAGFEKGSSSVADRLLYTRTSSGLAADCVLGENVLAMTRKKTTTTTKLRPETRGRVGTMRRISRRGLGWTHART